jgi:putative membrane protein
MNRRILLALAAGLLASTANAQNPPTQSAPVMSDTQFLDRALAGNRFEVEAGRLAERKTTDAKLKDFARLMVADHGKALAELQEISKGLNRPVPDKLGSQHQAKLNALQAKDGAGFDTAYVAEMKAAHGETLVMLQSHRQVSRHDTIKAWIDKALPTVQRHKSMIDGM